MVTRKYPHGQCRHGMCLDHEPEWENVGNRREPTSGVFGNKTYWMNRHSGRAMAMYREIQSHKCKECGRIEDEVVNYDIALCLCCGHYFTYVSREVY